MCILLIYMWITGSFLVELSTETLYFVYESVDKTIYKWIICGFYIVITVDNVKKFHQRYLYLRRINISYRRLFPNY